MPVIQHLMRSLQKEYGGKGKEVYYAMMQKAGGDETKLRSALKSGEFQKKKPTWGKNMSATERFVRSRS